MLLVIVEEDHFISQVGISLSDIRHDESRSTGQYDFSSAHVRTSFSLF